MIPGRLKTAREVSESDSRRPKTAWEVSGWTANAAAEGGNIVPEGPSERFCG